MDILGIVMRWLHLTAAFTWLGGLIFMNVVLTPAVAPRGIPPQFIRLMGMKRFSRFAWGSIAVLVITGIYNTATVLSSPANLITTTYGIVLLIKIIAVALMIGITAENNLILAPKLMAGAPKPPNPPDKKITGIQKTLVKLSYVNLILGFTVLLLVAILRVAPNF